MKSSLPLFVFLFVACAVNAQWSTESTTNTPVETTASCNFLSKRRIISDNAGNVFVTWFDKRVNDRYKVFVQKFNSQGVAQWTENGTGVAGTTTDQVYSEIISDGNGGVIVSWTESRSTTGFDIYAQRLSSAGAVQWGSNGIAVAVAGDEQNFSRIAPDGNGGAFICWYDLRNAGGNSAKEIFIQKLNSSGVAAFAANGIKVPDARPDAFNWINEPAFWIHKNGTDAVITWEHKVVDNGTNMYAQKISSTGTALWGANGLAITNTIGSHEQSSSAVDNAGNLFIAWKNYSKDSLLIQKINSAGAVQWTQGGVKLVDVWGSNAYLPKVVADNNGGAIVIWDDNRGAGFDVYMQKLNSAGLVQLNVNGVALCNATRDQSQSEIVSDGDGGAIVTWEDKRINNDSTDIYAQRISSAGVPLWAANGVAVSNAKFKQRYPSIAPYGSMGAVISWFDNRNAADATVFCNDIFIQPVKADGTLGDPNVVSGVRNNNVQLASVKTYPNPVLNELIVENFHSSALSYKITDVTGKVLFTGVIQKNTISPVAVHSLVNGVYILQLTNKKGEAQTVRFVKSSH
jgi:hypothetical protein